MPAATNSGEPTARHRPKALTVFAAAFVAGAAAAVGVNRLLDVHIARSRPQIECEPIFVALRSLPQGAPVTVWDVALRDWPKAMMPGSALRAHDSFEGLLLRHPLREGQPLLSVQLMAAGSAAGLNAVTAPQEAFVSPVPATAAATPPSAEADLWAPDEPNRQPPIVAAQKPAMVATTDIATPAPTRFTVPAPAEVPAPAPAQAAVTTTDVNPPWVAALPPEPDAGQDSTAALMPDDDATPTDDDRHLEAEAAAIAAVPTPAEPDAAATGTSDDATDTSGAAATSDAATATSDAAEPTDPATLPSVVTSKGGEQAAPTAEPGREQPRRYLVVPERIALQADSSFSAPPPATPSAPVAAPAAIAPAATPAAPPSALARQPATQATTPPGGGQQAVTPRQQAQPNRGRQSPSHQGQNVQPGRSQQAQPARVQQAQPGRGPQVQPGRAPEVQPNRGKPVQQPQRNRPAPTTSTRVAPQRTWERPFPNVAAGLEAIGHQWQQIRSGDEAVADAGGAGNDRRR